MTKDRIQQWAKKIGPATQVPGGCDDCDAYQRVVPDPIEPRLTHINVFHDEPAGLLHQVRVGVWTVVSVRVRA